MAWNSLTFSFESVLTSNKMTQLYDNLTALANGDSGAPHIQQAALGAGIIHQTELSTSLGSVSGDGHHTLPGGTYGFYPQIRASKFGVEDYVAQITNLNTPGTSYATRIYLSADGTPSAQQRYINSSPPYDLGDGEIPLFVFAEVSPAGDVLRTYTADVPPWAYNGPTRVDGRPTPDGRKVQVRRVIDPVTGDIYTETIEVTNDIKNADMHLIPCPWDDVKPVNTVVLLDPCETLELKLMHESGEEVHELFNKGYLVIDDVKLERRTPIGVQAVPIKWRNPVRKWR